MNHQIMQSDPNIFQNHHALHASNFLGSSLVNINQQPTFNHTNHNSLSMFQPSNPNTQGNSLEHQ